MSLVEFAKLDLAEFAKLALVFPAKLVKFAKLASKHSGTFRRYSLPRVKPRFFFSNQPCSRNAPVILETRGISLINARAANAGNSGHTVSAFLLRNEYNASKTLRSVSDSLGSVNASSGAISRLIWTAYPRVQYEPPSTASAPRSGKALARH